MFRVFPGGRWIVAIMITTSPESLFREAVRLHQAGQLDQAEIGYRSILAAHPEHDPSLTNLAILRLHRGRPEEALALFDRSLAVNGNQPPALANRGAILCRLGRFPEALADLDRAIALRPADAAAHSNRGFALNALGRHAEALESCDRALALQPDHPEAFNNRGSTLANLGRLNDAIADFDRAIALRSDYVEAYNNLGVAMLAVADPVTALALFDRVAALQPDSAVAQGNRGEALETLGRHEESLAAFNRALELKPDHVGWRGFRLHERMYLCDWAGIDEDFAAVRAGLERGEPAIGPFPFLSVPSSPAQQRKCAELFAARRFPSVPESPEVRSGTRTDRIRVGYFSADYRDHVLANLIVDLIESHDRSSFEVYGYSYGPDTGDPMRRRLERAFDSFADIRGQSDADAAALARKHGLDIAIDLTGYTTHSRVGIFSHRPAPAQVSYLGYPGTLGAPFMDYLIADPVVIPESEFANYREKIVWLPPSFQVNGDGRPALGRAMTRAEAGLPEDGFVFCCFCNSYKLTPDAFDIWMRLLRQVQGSVLWMVETSVTAARNLRIEAARRGVDAARLVFGPRTERAEYQARLSLADLFLDTFYYNAGVTASDALWAGLPVLTCPGDTFVARMAASLLTAVGLPELIAPSRERYEILALELATVPQTLNGVRKRLLANRSTSPLFDAARFTRGIESAYRRMVERTRAGLPPEHIRIPAHE